MADDTLKRESIRRSEHFRVWSLSYKDVQNVFASQGDYYTDTLEPTKMPSGKMMYLPTVKKEEAEAFTPSKMTAFDQLIYYLKNADAEKMFRAHAYAYGMSLLEPALLKNQTARVNWNDDVRRINDQANYTFIDLNNPELMFGTWKPRQINSHLKIYAGIERDAIKAGKMVSVCAVLDDEKDKLTDRYENEWNGLLLFSNVMQFADEYIGVSADGIEKMTYLNLPVVAKATPVTTNALDDKWNDILELLVDNNAKAFAQAANDEGIPAPSDDDIGIDLEGVNGEVIATAEIVWPKQKIAYLTEDQLENKEIMEAEGWKIINILNIEEMKSMFGGNN